MCGRYTVNTEDEIIELREILQEISRRLMKENAGEDGNVINPAAAADKRLLRRLSLKLANKAPREKQEYSVQREQIIRQGHNELNPIAVTGEQMTFSEDFTAAEYDAEDYGQNGIEAYPSCLTPLILPDREIRQVKWGFPKWDNKGVIFNARSEGIASGRFFSPYLESGRCLVPASSYFEWIRINKKPADKFKIFAADSRFIFMAGLFKKNIGGSMEFVIITRAAADNIRFIHPRMPVVLKPEFALEWLNGGFSEELFKLVADLSCAKQA